MTDRMTTNGVPLLPVNQMPLFARKMVAVWRLRHLAAGEELGVLVYPGDWPEGVPHEVKGVEVKENEWVQEPGSVWVLGRKGDGWYGATTLAAAECADWTVDSLAIVTFYVQAPNDKADRIHVWMHESPETGEVPMWSLPRAGASS